MLLGESQKPLPLKTLSALIAAADTHRLGCWGLPQSSLMPVSDNRAPWWLCYCVSPEPWPPHLIQPVPLHPPIGEDLSHWNQSTKSRRSNGWIKSTDINQGNIKHENQGNMTPPQEHNNFPVTGCRDKEIYELSDKEFRILALRKFSKFQKTKTKTQMYKWTKSEI